MLPIVPGEREMIYWARTGVFREPLDASTRSTHIPGTGSYDFPASVTPDGERLLYTEMDPVTAADIYDIPLAGGTPRPIVRTRAYEGGAEVSPDGRWIVYASNESGQNEVFLQDYPTPDGRVQVSSQGGTQPTWNPKGGEIFYRRGDDMMSARVTFGAAGPALDPPVKLFAGRYVFGAGTTTANYSVIPDGGHFLMVKEPSRAILNVVLNWFDEVKAAAK